MGRWNYRRRWTPKNYYRDQRIPSPPTYYETEFKLRGAWKNVDLPWEERFCISVGIPWEKVVNTKKYMHCYDNVVNWNDSAGEEAFYDAKKRFWAKINGIPTDDPQLDPDMYTSKIDWNPEIDPELVKDLDLAYFNPDEPEKVEHLDAAKKKDESMVPGCILGLDNKNQSNIENPWERNNNKTSGWNCSNNSVNKNICDPWERGTGQDDRETKENAWGGGGSSSWHKDGTWGGAATNSWHWKQYQVQRVDERNGGSFKETGWGSHGQGQWHGRESGVRGTQPSRPPCKQRGGYTSGRGQWRGQHDAANNRSGWESNVRKREGPQQYTSSYKSARVQYDDYREGNQYGR